MTQETNTTLNDGVKALFKSCAGQGCATEKLQRYKTVLGGISKIEDVKRNFTEIESLGSVVERFYIRQRDVDVNTGYPSEYKIQMVRAGDSNYAFNIHVDPLTDEEGNIVFIDRVSEEAGNQKRSVSLSDFEEIVANRIYEAMTLPERAALEAAYQERTVTNDTVRKPDVA